jgi:DNA-binding Xre family transcriptional regulator
MKKRKPITISSELIEIMKNKGIKSENLALSIGLSPASFSLRKHGNVPWELEKCYQILDILEIPRSDIARYFADSDGNTDLSVGIELINHVIEEADAGADWMRRFGEVEA